jgi:hypothetical protein
MKKIVLLAAGVVFLAAAQAQEIKERSHRGNMKGHHGMVMEKLNFTDAQKSQMKSINEDFNKKMAELKKNENITVKEWKSRMKALRDEHKAKMEGLLTTEQKTQIEKMKSEHKAMRDVDEKARMEKMKVRLGLSDDQVAKLSKNRTEMEQKIKAIRANKSMDETKKKEEIKELMKANKEKMNSIFTEEQLKKMEEGRQMHHKGDKNKSDKNKSTI